MIVAGLNNGNMVQEEIMLTNFNFPTLKQPGLVIKIM